MSFSNYYQDFLSKLQLDFRLPEGIGLLYPYHEAEVERVCKIFYGKFYREGPDRIFLIGINPGRFGAGITGIPFTDPIRLEEKCRIPNAFDKRPELSSVFIYDMIDAYGGVEAFYSRFFVTAVSPLGFIKNGKNLNYYDNPALQRALEPFIVASMREQLDMGGRRDVAFSIGMGKNAAYLHYLNKKYHFFDEVGVLPHPRWIMQYRLKKKEGMIETYLDKLSKVI